MTLEGSAGLLKLGVWDLALKRCPVYDVNKKDLVFWGLRTKVPGMSATQHWFRVCSVRRVADVGYLLGD